MKAKTSSARFAVATNHGRTSRNTDAAARADAPPRKRKAGARAAPAALGACDQPDPAAHRRTGPAEERQPGQGAGQGAKSQGAQGRSPAAA